MLFEPGPGKQSAVESKQMFESDRSPDRDTADRGGHRIDIRQDLLGRDIGGLLAKLLRGFGTEKAPRADLQALDAG